MSLKKENKLGNELNLHLRKWTERHENENFQKCTFLEIVIESSLNLFSQFPFIIVVFCAKCSPKRLFHADFCKKKFNEKYVLKCFFLRFRERYEIKNATNKEKNFTNIW